MGTGGTGGKKAWWHVTLFRGMVKDVRRRVPYYASDFSDAWDYRIVPSSSLSSLLLLSSFPPSSGRQGLLGDIATQ